MTPAAEVDAREIDGDAGVAGGRRPRRARVIAAVVAIAIASIAVAGFAAFGADRSTPTGALDPPRFVEETATAGLNQTFDGPLAYFVGGGVAVLDCDADGRPDLYVAGGVNRARLFHNDSPIGGALRFSAIPDAATDLAAVEGAYPLDVNGDGNIDLAILRNGANVLLRGLGGCRFENATEQLGLDGGTATTTAFSATWEGAATLPTLAFGNYVDPAATDPHDLCFDNELVRPAASGTDYGPPIPLTPSWCALSMLFSDWDRSGRRDLRVSNDQHYYMDGEEQLWRMEPGTPPRLYTADEGWVRMTVEGMGIASQDVTGDGYPDVFLTSQGENRLQTLTNGPAQPTYRDIGLKRGVSADRPFTGGDTLPSTAWHPEFGDVNNDGFPDLFISKGNVRQEDGFAMKDPSNLLLGQADGTFVERADQAGVLSFDLGRGAALTDLNLDGLLDLVEVNLGTPVKAWRNVGAGSGTSAAPLGHWLAIRAEQPGPNVDAIGAWLEIRIGNATQLRELTVGGGHAGGELGWTHIGLGPATTAEVRVTWPDGTVGPWQQTAADGFVIAQRGAAALRAWQPTAP